ncbi:unnamed protein product [marine sediment metagenome]|uniref:Uncharacterized protein n=1 Tax=marine sediment metagenome TaxID=412755 RepID=X1RGD2_9ZZZZ
MECPGNDTLIRYSGNCIIIHHSIEEMPRTFSFLNLCMFCKGKGASPGELLGTHTENTRFLNTVKI